SQQETTERSDGHARRGLPGARPLQDITDVPRLEFQGTGQVDMAWPRPGNRTNVGSFRHSIYCHGQLPICPVPVLDDERYGAPQVLPWRTPDMISTWSFSMRIRPPRP